MRRDGAMTDPPRARDMKAEAMVWLALWCGSGAIVGWMIGHSSGRPGLGAFLGAFCGPFGWLMLLGAAPKQRVVQAPSGSSVYVAVEEEHAEITAVDSPPPISWVAQTA
jgi:hypothetical protein